MIKGILFDKDGTLIDFFSLWLGAAKAVVIQFLKENELSEEVRLISIKRILSSTK